MWTRYERYAFQRRQESRHVGRIYQNRIIAGAGSASALFSRKPISVMRARLFALGVRLPVRSHLREAGNAGGGSHTADRTPRRFAGPSGTRRRRLLSSHATSIGQSGANCQGFLSRVRPSMLPGHIKAVAVELVVMVGGGAAMAQAAVVACHWLCQCSAPADLRSYCAGSRNQAIERRCDTLESSLLRWNTWRNVSPDARPIGALAKPVARSRGRQAFALCRRR